MTVGSVVSFPAGAGVCASAVTPSMREAAPEVAHIVFVNTDMPDPHKPQSTFVVFNEFAALAVDCATVQFRYFQ